MAGRKIQARKQRADSVSGLLHTGTPAVARAYQRHPRRALAAMAEAPLSILTHSGPLSACETISAWADHLVTTSCCSMIRHIPLPPCMTASRERPETQSVLHEYAGSRPCRQLRMRSSVLFSASIRPLSLAGHGELSIAGPNMLSPSQSELDDFPARTNHVLEVKAVGRQRPKCRSPSLPNLDGKLIWWGDNPLARSLSIYTVIPKGIHRLQRLSFQSVSRPCCCSSQSICRAAPPQTQRR